MSKRLLICPVDNETKLVVDNNENKNLEVQSIFLEKKTIESHQDR